MACSYSFIPTSFSPFGICTHFLMCLVGHIRSLLPRSRPMTAADRGKSDRIRSYHTKDGAYYVLTSPSLPPHSPPSLPSLSSPVCFRRYLAAARCSSHHFRLVPQTSKFIPHLSLYIYIYVRVPTCYRLHVTRT